MRVNISSENLERLKSLTLSHGAEFDVQPSGLDEEFPKLPFTIELSSEITDRLEKTYEDSTDCSFDEPVWQFNEAIKYLLDRKEAGKLN